MHKRMFSSSTNFLSQKGIRRKTGKVVVKRMSSRCVLFAGLFLPSGKTFIDHLVGAAGILLPYLHMPVELVAAGLIHAAYLHGDFGGATKGISEIKRKQLGPWSVKRLRSTW